MLAAVFYARRLAGVVKIFTYAGLYIFHVHVRRSLSLGSAQTGVDEDVDLVLQSTATS